jgi:hypothetical protein
MVHQVREVYQVDMLGLRLWVVWHCPPVMRDNRTIYGRKPSVAPRGVAEHLQPTQHLSWGLPIGLPKGIWASHSCVGCGHVCNASGRA